VILLWGRTDDDPLVAVHAVLTRQGAAVVLLDQRVELRTEIRLSVGDAVAGGLVGPDVDIDLTTVTAAYLRPHDVRRLREMQRAEAGDIAYVLEFEDALLAWSEVAPALVLNRPAAMAANNSKPFQAVQARRAGFRTPATLITTSPDRAIEFADEHHEVVYKSISGVRSIVARFDPSDRKRLEDLAWCPTQFQERVPGRDVRVHVVGSLVFACEIVSDAVDYRYAARQRRSASLRPIRLPADCELMCRQLAAAVDLPLAGIDLRETPDGAWYCFEVNPSPGFTYYEDAVGHPIADAVAELLRHPVSLGLAATKFEAQR
jgi:hypothetical protein